MKLTVRVYERDKEIEAKEFGEGTFRIGRSEFADINLAHESVSRSHVELRVTGTSAYATNMSAAGRIKVNGASKETAELSDGDEIRVGRYRIVILIDPAGEPGDGPVAPAQSAPVEEANEAPADNGGGGEAFAGFGDGVAGDNNGGGLFGEGNGQGFIQEANNDNDRGNDGGNVAVAVAEEDPPAPAFRVIEGGGSQIRDTDAAARPLIAKLLFLEGPRANEEIRLDAYEITMGRSKRADVFLDDTKLSRIHAKISRVGNGYRLVDLDSRNGTYVNGIRVLEHPLSSFDVIELGKSKLRFLIADLNQGAGPGGRTLAVANGGGSQAAVAIDETRSVALAAVDPAVLAAANGEPQQLGFPADYGAMPEQEFAQYGTAEADSKKKRNRLLIAGVAALLVVYALVPNGETKKAEPPPEVQQADVGTNALMPKEYNELSPELQRIIEGAYNSAQRAAELNQFEEAVGHLKKVHEYLPYYKDSRDLLEIYGRRLREQQIADAQKKAKQDEKQDLQLYLNEGLEYLGNGDFDRAAEAFNSAVVIDPTNQVAIQGLKAAEAKVRRIEDLPPDRDPEEEKKKLVAELFRKAVDALQAKSYTEAIDIAERIRQIEIKSDSQYLAEANSLIDQAKKGRREEFEPFLISAQDRFEEGDYGGSRDLCEEMVKRDPTYEDAQTCVLKAKKQLNRLAKEAYIYGYILESMNRLEEAKQYFQRGKNYTRPGDEYFDKLLKKLDN